MKGKSVWLVAACSLALSLLLVSCAPSPTPTSTPTTTPPTTTPPTTTPPTTTPAVKEPQYGGTLTVISLAGVEPDQWDPINYTAQMAFFMGYYFETLFTGDLSRGPRGSNEFGFNDSYYVPDKFLIPSLAESWEQPDPLTVVFHVRKGVYFQDKPGVMAAREMTASDIAFSLNRLITNWKLQGTRFDWLASGSATAQDKYTVVVKMSYYNPDWKLLISGIPAAIVPPELVTAGIGNWRNTCGTGPYSLKDYVSGSSLTYEWNQNYWGKTTIAGKEYKLPFVRRIVLPQIPDESTRLAAIQTGKGDISEAVSWRYKDTLAKTNPQLKVIKVLADGAPAIGMKFDTAPFDNMKVRRAMNMALDRQAIINSQAGGEAVFLNWPFSMRWPRTLYTPLEEYPQETRELFTYNPQKAKQLLAEAGYPNGFKAELNLNNPASVVDLCSMAAAYWKEIGVDVELKIREQATHVSIIYGKAYKHMIYVGMSNSAPESILRNAGWPGDFYNTAIYNNQYFNDLYEKQRVEKDTVKRDAMLRELNQLIVNSTGYIIFPTPYVYRYAWPWVNNYYGETNASRMNRAPIFSTIWIDQKMKESMGR